MDERDQIVLPLATPIRPDASLPYAVELWDLSRGAVEAVIGRAASAVLARAIYDAAQNDHLGRRIVLRHGDRVIAETD